MDRTTLLALPLLVALGPATALARGDLAAQVRFALQGSGVDTSAVTVRERDGVVTLGGRVENASARRDVLDAARRTHGVVDVVDGLETDY